MRLRTFTENTFMMVHFGQIQWTPAHQNQGSPRGTAPFLRAMFCSQWRAQTKNAAGSPTGWRPFGFRSGTPSLSSQTPESRRRSLLGTFWRHLGAWRAWSTNSSQGTPGIGASAYLVNFKVTDPIAGI